MDQKTAVYNVVKKVLEDRNISFEDGMDAATLLRNCDGRKEVQMLIQKAFETGEISLESKQDNLKKYSSNVVSNWLRKDKRLNGGVKFEIKNKGSRPKDEQLAAIQQLLNQTVNPGERILIEAALNKRKAEIQLTKAKNPSIDRSKLPDNLRALLDS